jgi:glycosidase
MNFIGKPRMRALFAIFVPLTFILNCAYSQDSLKVYPTNWWVGMKNQDLELMIHYKGVGKMANVSASYPGVEIMKVQMLESMNYLFIDLHIDATAKPGHFAIRLSGPGTVRKPGAAEKGRGGNEALHEISFEYTLLPRRPGNGTAFAQGISQADFIYFLMPDRFSNGDPANDRIPGMRDQSLNRDSIFLRHGGDFQGIINHLDYIQGMGATTLWMTPVLENDMPDRTEHGYACTDHYTIEPRLGGAAMYRKLSDELHRRGMKLIQDAVYNHVGLYHFFVQDLPSKDWLHQWPHYTQTSFRDQPLMDPHASAIDRKITSDGWFTPQMPDLNQGNPYLARFLIQHAVWCVETFGVDAWRIDTYIYNDLEFMNRCNKALLDEYPRITMFGESWVHGVANQAYFTANRLDIPYKSNLTGATDFQLNFTGIAPAMGDSAGNGVQELYNTLADDFLYKDPTRNVIFLDNHDMSRFFSQVGEDKRKQAIGLKWLLTERGIPQLYYGTEILMKGFANPDGWVRLDFPGGWTGDKKDGFTGEGLTADEASTQALVRKLGNFRKTSSALRNGKLMQYLPERGLYVYFRYDEKQTILCAMNAGERSSRLDFSRFRERTAVFKEAVDVLSGRHFNLDEPAEIPGWDMWVLELRK